MRPINSMIEFKQIIGRGTRLYDGKDYFTVYDFVKAYEHFSDPEWDGEPIEPVPPAARTSSPSPEPPSEPTEPTEPREPPGQKIKIKLADGKERTIQHMMATTFWSTDGKPMSAAEFIERLFGDLPALFKDEDELRAIWSNPDTRRALLEGLTEKGYGQEQLAEIRRMIDAENSDLFDVLAYIAFALSPITREERVVANKGRIFSHYGYKEQEFLDFVLDHYIKQGVGELDKDKLPTLLELKYHGINDAVAELGPVAGIRGVFVGFQEHLYARQGRS
jgi:type I restriction enzyme R subunit